MRSSRHQRNLKKSDQFREPAILELSLTIDCDAPIPEPVARFIEAGRERIQIYWDRWLDKPIEQYVACDFEYVWHAFQAIRQSDLLHGKSFVEWGCGFGVVTGLAWLSGLSAVGVEAESFLVDEGMKLLRSHSIAAELWHGNFLPSNAEELVDRQSGCPSLHHPVPPAYSAHQCELSDFALIFDYPWPGEDHFHREVFRHYAGSNSHLLFFRGPYHIELYRKL